MGASSSEDRATAAEPVVSALRDGIPSAADDLRLHHTAFRPTEYEGKPRYLKQEHKELFATFVEPLWERVESLSTPDLWQLIEACQAVSQINCAWSDYAMAGLLHDVATHDLANRLAAQAIEAHRAETQGGSVHESAVLKGCAQTQDPQS